MGGTSKSFGMKLDKIHNYEERPGPQNYSPVEPYTLSKFRKDGETVFGGEVRGSLGKSNVVSPGPGTYNANKTIGNIP